MSKAFRCDICGEVKDGVPYELVSESVKYDLCGKCHLRINELFTQIAKENNFINDFNDPDNSVCYD